MTSPDFDRTYVERHGLYGLVRLAWHQVDPARFLDNWHIGLVCEHLEAQSRFELKQLVINVPPGCSKSLLVNVFWPVFDWISVNPASKWIYGSYDQSLVGQRDGGRILSLIRSGWFVDRWSTLLDSSVSSASNFDTCAGGYRFATSPGGKGLGRHADHVVCDDPIKPQDTLGAAAVTKRAIQKVSDWWANNMSLRQTDPTRHTRTIIMQRLHRDDLAGEMIDKGYTVLSLPMRAPVRVCVTPIGVDPRKPGELLFPKRFPLDVVEANEKTLGPRGAAAQYGQKPIVDGGNVFKRSSFRFWGKGREPCTCDECMREGRSLHDTGRDCQFATLPESGWRAQSWDLSFKGKATSDFVAATDWLGSGAYFYLLDILNERLDFAATKAKMLVWSKSTTVLVEDAANGPAIQSELATSLPGLIMVQPLGGKEARAHSVTPSFIAEKVLFPREHPLLYTMMSQLEAFPLAANDDIVDSISQGLSYFRQSSNQGLFDAMGALLRK